MTETFYGQWDIYALADDGGNLSLATSQPMVETAVGLDNTTDGGDTSTVSSGDTSNTVDSASQDGSSVDGDSFVGTITAVGGATVYVVTDGFGNYFGVVATGTDLSAGIASQAAPTNTVTW